MASQPTCPIELEAKSITLVVFPICVKIALAPIWENLLSARLKCVNFGKFFIPSAITLAYLSPYL